MDEFMDLIFNPNDNLNVDLKEMQDVSDQDAEKFQSPKSARQSQKELRYV